MPAPALPALRRPAGDGRLLQIGALGALPRLAPGQGPGRGPARVAVIEHTLAPRTLGAPPHRHSREDEIAYVLDGQLSVEVGTEVLVAEAGDLIVKPRGLFHAFWNSGAETVHFLELIVPGDLAPFFGELAGIAPHEAPPDPAAVAALGARYGVEYQLDRVPDLCARHGVRW